MTSQARRLVWTIAIVVPLLSLTATAIVYVYGLPPVIKSLLNRNVAEPASEDYAVYSAFVDGFMSSNLQSRADRDASRDGIVGIAAETLPMKSGGSILPLDVVALGPNDAGEDFFRQNARSWRLEPSFHTKVRVDLVGSDMVRRAGSWGVEGTSHQSKNSVEHKSLPDADRVAPFPDSPQVVGVLQVSRAGFNRRRTVALLYYIYRCGALCGQSGLVVLQKTEGIWRIKEFGSSIVY